MGRWLAVPMKNRSGMESRVLVREARKARRAMAGRFSTFSPLAEAMIFFWRGQITNQTLTHITVPMMAPVRMVAPQELLNRAAPAAPAWPNLR